MTDAGSHSAAKNALAALSTSLTQRSSAFSRRSRRFFLDHVRCRPAGSITAIGLDLTNPVPQRLVMHTELLGQRRITGLGSDSRYKRTVR
ncbi:hypothetical protein [Micromonospora sp. KC723]|uniref:hypothetical protein n=1 Tax=Micromonospora sp. KC723 TaxID=2530381 RepID=UPI0010502D88|nr:hypothetical protein [Micromonospora sp. KC723]TDB71834.1 hypothetical protein E1165_21900 [Micromonospora sp. KC723]